MDSTVNQVASMDAGVPWDQVEQDSNKKALFMLCLMCVPSYDRYSNNF